ncbi:MAG: hypothetical protein LC734_07215 [Acidobacteria bacterium]|nr:hypothetical protein [Acidobacteriota bacterium]
MQQFQELGQGIEARWRAANYNETVFPQLAAEGLARAAIPSKLNAWDVIDTRLSRLTGSTRSPKSDAWISSSASCSRSVRFRR